MSAKSKSDLAKWTGYELLDRRRRLAIRMNRLAWAARDVSEAQPTGWRGRFEGCLKQWDRLDVEKKAIDDELELRRSLVRSGRRLVAR